MRQCCTVTKHDCSLARADHKTLLQLEKEVDTLVALIKAEMPVEESKALLADISVSVRAHLASSVLSMQHLISRAEPPAGRSDCTANMHDLR